MSEIIDAVDRFRAGEPLRELPNDPGLRAIQRLPMQAGLATRVRTMIDAGSTDEAIDRYIEGWIESATRSPNQTLHRELDALRRGLRPYEA